MIVNLTFWKIEKLHLIITMDIEWMVEIKESSLEIWTIGNYQDRQMKF